MTKEVAIKKKESFWERNKKSNDKYDSGNFIVWNVLYDSSADSK